MMALMQVLIDKGMLNQDTVVTLATRKRNQPADWLVMGISHDEGVSMLRLRELDGSSITAVPTDDVIAIDGMAIDRYADVYNINRDGTSKITGKKRGRKPKIRSITAF